MGRSSDAIVVIGVPVDFDVQVLLDEYEINDSNIREITQKYGRWFHCCGNGPLGKFEHIIGLEVLNVSESWEPIPKSDVLIEQAKELLPLIQQLLSPMYLEAYGKPLHLDDSRLRLYVGSYYG